jgi:hypothetical protein
VVAKRDSELSWEDARASCGRSAAAKQEEPREKTEFQEITESLAIGTMSLLSRL